MIFDIIIRREDGVDFQPIIINAIKDRLQYILDQTIIWLRYNNVNVDDYYNNQLCFNSGSEVVCSTRAPTRFPTPPPTNMKPTNQPSPRPTPLPTRFPTTNPTQDQNIIIPIDFLDISLPIDMDIVDFRNALLDILKSIVYEIEQKYSRLQVTDVKLFSRRLNAFNSSSNDFIRKSDGGDLGNRILQRAPFDVKFEITIKRESGVNYERIIKDAVRKDLESIMRGLLDWIRSRSFIIEEGYRFKLCFESRYGYECVEQEPRKPTNRPTRFPTPNPTDFPHETITVEFSDVVLPFGADVDALRKELGVALKNILLDVAAVYKNLEILDVTNTPTSDDSDLFYDVIFHGQDGVNFNFVLLQAIKSRRQDILNAVLRWFQRIGFDDSLASEFNFKYCFETNYGFVDCSNADARLPPTSRPTTTPSKRPTRRPTRRPTLKPTNRPETLVDDEVVVPIRFSLEGLPRNTNMRALASDIRALLMSLILDLSDDYDDLQIVDVQHITDRRYLKDAEIAYDIIVRGERGVAFYSLIRDSIRSFLDSMVEDIYDWAHVVEELTLCFLSDNDSAASGFADCATYYRPPNSGKPPSVLQPKPSNPAQASPPSISYPNPSSPPGVPVPSPPPPNVVFIPMPGSPTATAPYPSSPTVVFIPTPSTPTETAPSPSPPTIVFVPIPSSPTATPPFPPSPTVVVVPTPEPPTIISIPSQTQPNVVPSPNSPTVLIPPQTQPTEVYVDGPPSAANKPNGAEIQAPLDRERISLEFTVLRVPNDVNSDQLRKELKDILKVILLNLEKRYKKMNVWDVEYRCQCSRKAQLESQQRTRSIGLGKTTADVIKTDNCDEVGEQNQSKGSRVLQSKSYDFIMTFDITIARREGQNLANVISNSVRRNHEAILDDLRKWAAFQYTNNFDFDLCIESTVGKGYVVCSSDSRPAITSEPTGSPTDLHSEVPSSSPTTRSPAFMTIHSSVEIAGYSIPLWLIILIGALVFVCLCCTCLLCCMQYRKKTEHKTINNNIKVEERTIVSKDSESSSSDSSDSEAETTVGPQRLYRPIMAMPQYMALPPPPQYRHQCLPAPQGSPLPALPPTMTPQQQYIQQNQHAPALQQNPFIQSQSNPVIQSSQSQRQLVNANSHAMNEPSDEEESSIDPSVGDIDGHTYVDFESISQPDQDMYSLFSDVNGIDKRRRKKESPSSSNFITDSDILLLTEETHEANVKGNVPLIGYLPRPPLQMGRSTRYLSSGVQRTDPPHSSLQREQSTRHLSTSKHPSAQLYARTESFRYNSSRHLKNHSATSVASESTFSALGTAAQSVWSEAPTKSSRKTKPKKLNKNKEHKSGRHERSRKKTHRENDSKAE